MPDYSQHLESLNPAQRQAALATEGAVLVIAGAGAGKTKTISHRILHLVKNGVAPQNILAITFTNKAAKEMRERVMHLISSDHSLNLPISQNESPFVSTFHALGVHILKENAAFLGIPRHFTIFDKSDSKRAVKEAVIASNLDPKQYEPGKVLNTISREKGNYVTLELYEERMEDDYWGSVVTEVWKRYEQTLRKEKALDFDDLLLRAALLLEENKEIRARYQKQWRYIHIDEYQDTNRVQYIMAKLLSEAHGNICVVGDGDQNIYSWRGAQIRNILNFEHDFPNSTVILLEKNYRSTKTILAAANSVIEKNVFRKEKNLFTENEDGEKIIRYDALDEQDEARFVASRASKLISGGASPSEIAVLYRANYQSRALEAAFMSQGVPYQVLGTKFFERKEVKDILSYIRAALNPDSASDLKRIINEPVRGIGKVTFLKVLSGKRLELSGAAKRNVDTFFSILSRIREMAHAAKPSELVRFVMKESGLERSYTTKNEEDLERIENMKELVSYAAKFDESETSEEGLEAFLTEAALMSDQDELDLHKAETSRQAGSLPDGSQSEQSGGVKLMTVHASKGLEFDTVFVTGLEQGLFPSTRAETSAPSEESEEERRLFYVAVTRARKRLFLTHADLRTIYGSQQAAVPSEFLYDIGDELMEVEIPTEDDERKSAIGKIFTIDF